MAIDSGVLAEARDRLAIGAARLSKGRPTIEGREKYVRGEQDLPFAPKGVNAEYMALRRQSIANWCELYVNAPVQRLSVEGIRTGIGADEDEKNATNAAVWRWFQANKWGKRQSTVFQSIMKHGIGVTSVWPGPRVPVLRPESLEYVYLHPDPEDPFAVDWAVKIVTVEVRVPSSLILPDSVARTKDVGWVYDADRVLRFERSNGAGEWRVQEQGSMDNPLGRVPFATFDYKLRADGSPWSGLDHMMVQQDALNSIRFNTLLAMQFSAFRQRIISGFDPRVLDDNGEPMYRTDADGEIVLDANGLPIPILVDIGKVGVDRLLAFPGADTKVYDLPESNLANYTAVYDSFLAAFFAVGQIPPQYQPQKLSNLTGDALAGAESTFASLIKEIQLAADEGVVETAELMWIADGRDPDEWEPSAEAAWANAEARSFSQIVDSITKLVSVGFPHRAAFEFIPGATDQKVERWMDQMDEESFSNQLAQVTRPFVDVTEGA